MYNEQDSVYGSRKQEEKEIDECGSKIKSQQWVSYGVGVIWGEGSWRFDAGQEMIKNYIYKNIIYPLV